MTPGLCEEFLLLALEDQGGEFSRMPETALSCGLAGAALMELALRERIDSDLSQLWVVNPAPTGSPVLDRILARIAAESTPLAPGAWIRRLMAEAPALRADALTRLCERGILRREDDTFLWVAKARRYPVAQEGERLEVKRRLLALLFNDEIPDSTDIALVALADACGLFAHLLAPPVLAQVEGRIRQISALDLIGGEIAQTAREITHELRTAERRTVLAGLAGNVMEWYDFGIYGFFAAVIGANFFPMDNPSASLLASFGVFAVGFIGRPLGALVFGHVGDSLGRKKALVFSVLTMAVPTALMAFLPTYAQIGIAAPLLLVLLRFAQGLAVGGEYTTSMVLLVEEALPGRRGLVGSFAPFGSVVGMLFGSIIGALITAYLPEAAVTAWGWRLAFLIGLVIGIVVIVVRSRLPEDEAATHLEASRQSPVALAFRTQRLAILRIIGVVVVQGCAFYLNFVYLTTWLNEHTALSHPAILVANGIALFLMICGLPLAGRLSDRIGRKPQLLLACVLLALFAWPLMALISVGTLPALLAGQGMLALLIALITGPITSFMVEAVPRQVRCTALSLGYNVALAAVGGTVPMVAIYLITKTGYALAPALYLAAMAVVSGLVIASMPVAPVDEEGAAGVLPAAR